MAALFLTALHWDQAQALTGIDRYRPRFAIRSSAVTRCPTLPESGC